MSETPEVSVRHGRAAVVAGSFACGVLTGAALMMCFTPLGAAARARLAAGVRQRRDDASALWERGRSTVEAARRHVDEQADHARNIVGEAGAAAHEIVTRAERAASSIGREIARAGEDAKGAYRKIVTGTAAPPRQDRPR